jgi:DMSO/TMAO reductase YedYZ molybdopterin-dependent catalytic subunit
MTLARRLTNLALAALTLGLVATGVGGWALPLDVAAPLFPLHRALAIALVALLIAKVPIARGALARRFARDDRSVAVGVGTALALGVALMLGFAWSAGAVGIATFAGYSAMNVHVFAGAALAALTLVHLAVRWERRPSLARVITRRAALRLGAVGLASLAIAPAIDAVEPLRRLTGSKHAGSFTGDAMPVTTWTFDAIPSIDVDSWRLEVAGRRLSYADLLALPRRESIAVLDCTSGWWSEQRWAGARLGDVLAGVEATEVRVVSATGHAWTFPLAEAKEMLLATHLGDAPLTPAHGFPARLVAPGRRGFQWVKWVARIERA